MVEISHKLTPQELVEMLDKYIIGQKEAKQSISIAIRNRYRRQNLASDIKEEVIPKNILMIGPTGVGKTEIARRLAKIIQAPFVKVEATKFTEVGYVGRNVESMVKDLVAESIRLVEEEKFEQVSKKARKQAENKIVDLLIKKGKHKRKNDTGDKASFESSNDVYETDSKDPVETDAETAYRTEREARRHARKEIKRLLAEGKLEEETVTIEVEEQPEVPGGSMGEEMENMGFNLQDFMQNIFPQKKKQKNLPVREARQILEQQEAQRLINDEQVKQEAVNRAENLGIIFLDEFDKIAVSDQVGQKGQDVSREGVQRDILPIVEGSSVNTKYGRIKTDHIMFIGAGAFHDSKPSDLIPELQGRFPIRVRLDSLSRGDFYKILTEPSNSLLNQYKALLETEGVTVDFTDEAVEEIARMAEVVNDQAEDIGARRLHTLLEKLLEELSFYASDMHGQHVDITYEYVKERLQDIVEEQDLNKYIL